MLIGLKAWLQRHRFEAARSLASIWRQRWSSLSTWGAMGIALGLPVFLLSFLGQLAAYEGQWQGQASISVYLKASAKALEAGKLTVEMEAATGVVQARLISKEEALAEFAAKTGMADILNAFDENPLPIVIEVIPSQSGGLAAEAFRQQFAKHPLVDEIVFDEAWMRRLGAIMETATRLIQALGLVMSLGVILIVSNMLRLAIENRRVEIEVQKLIGATDAFVRRPFLYFGLWHGLGGGLVASLLVQGALIYLSGPVESLAQSYRSGFALQGLGLAAVLMLLLFAALLGLLSAWMAAGQHLRAIEPE